MSLWYCDQSLAILSLGNHDHFKASAEALLGSNSVFESLPCDANHAWLAFIGRTGSPNSAGNRWERHSSSQGIARYRWFPHSWLDSGSTDVAISPPRDRRMLKNSRFAGQTDPKRSSWTLTPSLVPTLHIKGTVKIRSLSE